MRRPRAAPGRLWLASGLWPLAALAQASGAPPDVGADTPSLFFTLVKTLVVLALVVALAYLSLNWGLRKLMGIRAAGQRLGALVTVLDRFPLDSRHTLWVVKAGQEVLLLGVGEGGVSLLTRLEPGEVERTLAERAEGAHLSPLLKKLLARRNGPPPPSA